MSESGRFGNGGVLTNGDVGEGDMDDNASEHLVKTEEREANSSPLPKPRRTRRCKKGEKAEKLKLANLMSKEAAIWDSRNKFHSNSNALLASWKRISDSMDMSVTRCKEIWKSLRDGYRYRNKAMLRYKSGASAHAGTVGNLSEDDWPYKDALSFLTHTSSTSRAQCQYSYTIKEKEKDVLSDSVQSISSAIGKLVDVAVSQAGLSTTLSNTTPPLKYDYVWKLIEHQYESMDDATINNINQQIINIAYDAVKK